MGSSRDSLTAVSSLGVLLFLCLLSYSYWDNPKQLLRYGFFLFLVIALLVVVRHVWFCVVGPLKASFGNRKEVNGRYYSTEMCPEIWPDLCICIGGKVPNCHCLLVDLNLMVRYGIAICIHARKMEFNLAVAQADHQTTKPPNLIPHQIFRLYMV